MPYVVSKDFAITVKLSAEDLAELLYMCKQATVVRPGFKDRRDWWINELEEWARK